jgi:predicted RNA-binding Zn ribbon-like protein
MRTRSTLPSLPLKYVGGDPSLDLVNTVDWTGAGLKDERLPDYAHLTRWAEGAGVLPREGAQRLRRLAARDPRAAMAALHKAWRLREVLRRLFVGIAADPPREDAAAAVEFAALLRGALQELRLERRGKGTARHAWTFPASGTTLDGFLSPVLWSAARLLASTDAEQLRECAGPDCGWIFVDRSRNGLRRWCEMQTCGTLEKTRRRSNRSSRRGA